MEDYESSDKGIYSSDQESYNGLENEKVILNETLPQEIPARCFNIPRIFLYELKF